MPAITLEDITQLVGLHLGVQAVNADDQLMEELGAESADIANIVASAEQKYHVTIKESELAQLHTPADLFALIRGRM